MVVVKTGEPIKRVFVKGRFDPGASPDEFQEAGVGPGRGEKPADPLEDEAIKPLVQERLATEKDRWEEDNKTRLEEAHEKGRAEGEAAAQAGLAEPVRLLKEVIASVEKGRERLLQEAETAVIDLSLAIARRFVKSAAIYSDDMIKDTIKSAVKMATEKEKVVIRINPEDLDQVKAHQDDIIFVGDGIGKLEVRPDKKVERGGCVIETEAGNIDARSETRFAELDKALKAAYLSAGEKEKEVQKAVAQEPAPEEPEPQEPGPQQAPGLEEPSAEDAGEEEAGPQGAERVPDEGGTGEE
ncbi:MAG: FliH/SctL family protein [Gemmatimonadota bacterium]|nr:FliH/SctL family protein [Gemmatimonadota bacterium]